MRLHTENTTCYLQTFATSIDRDPFSLEAWKCLHIHPLDGQHVDLHALEVLKASNKDSDCDIVVCADHDILLVSRSMNYETMHTLGAALCATLDSVPEATFMDLYRDWQILRSILVAKIGEPICPASPPAHYNFGQVSALREVFNEAQKRRGARQPLHVMIVEDDAMTRRIVANTFKQHYAIISAENAEQAVANYLLHAPDVVFLDIGLPDASGFDVLRQIIASDPHAFVVMFSGNSYLDNVITALNDGASGFVSKPFRPEKLHHYIHASTQQQPH